MSFLLQLQKALRSPIIRLTLWYVLIVIVISIGFSVFIYRQTATQLRQDFIPRGRVMMDFGDPFTEPIRTRVQELFQQQYDLATDHLRARLILTNLVVLLAASLASYFLAKRTLRPIEESLEEQRRFTADASHELRTPLTAMRSEIEVALRNASTKPEEHADILRSNLEEIHRLEELSRGLLRLARSESDAKSASWDVTPVSTIVDDAVRQVTPHAEKKHITLNRVDIGGSWRGDKHSFVELLVILLDNAIKYSDEKTTVRVVGEASHRQVSIRVQDHGIGMKASDIPHIFDRFYRADSSRTKNTVDGYGLGLPIAKQITERFNGKITVASTIGEGSTFTVTFPRVNA
jgi:signal transduction histidine kinase